MIAPGWIAAALLLGAAPAAAQDAPPPPQARLQPSPGFQARVAELAAILSGTGSYDGFFDAGFRAAVPRAQFDALSLQLRQANGPVGAVRIVALAGPDAGTLAVDYGTAVATVQMAVSPASPHRVTGLRITGVTARAQTLDEIAAAFAALPGSAGFALARLGGVAPELLAGHAADRPLAIGSAFKLVILAELVRATNAGERRWDDMVTLDGALLPGGGYTLKPVGTRVTLRELAAQMIAVSDNSATDILLRALGREKVEAMMPVLGIRDPARNRPFLATLEAFKLKGIGGGALAGRYLALDEAGRRAMLANEVAAAPIAAIDSQLFKAGRPLLIDRVEWFESASDLVRVMDWLRRNTEGARGVEARAILSKNPGLAPQVAGRWQWVGYKGGSEPGVMNMTLLLQARDGAWYVLAASWNDSARAVDELRFAGLVGRAAELAAP
jgi:hypothetical protein